MRSPSQILIKQNTRFVSPDSPSNRSSSTCLSRVSPRIPFRITCRKIQKKREEKKKEKREKERIERERLSIRELYNPRCETRLTARRGFSRVVELRLRRKGSSHIHAWVFGSRKSLTTRGEHARRTAVRERRKTRRRRKEEGREERREKKERENALDRRVFSSAGTPGAASNYSSLETPAARTLVLVILSLSLSLSLSSFFYL